LWGQAPLRLLIVTLIKGKEIFLHVLIFFIFSNVSFALQWALASIFASLRAFDCVETILG